MPELPEVETIKNFLIKKLLEKKILNVEIFSRKQFIGDKKKIRGEKIKEIKRRGKLLIFILEKYALLIHLKMTGQLIFSENKEKIKSTRVIFKLDNGYLIFNDARKFAWIKIVKKEEIENYFLKLGKEPFDKDFTFDYLKEIVKKSSKPIKILLMDQTKIAGIGNIYANEALFLARINPQRKAKSLNETEIKNLYKTIKNVLRKGIKLGGASVRFYIRPDKSKGNFQEKVFVYKREGKNCYICGKIIKRIKLGGRSTFFCSRCQN